MTTTNMLDPAFPSIRRKTEVFQSIIPAIRLADQLGLGPIDRKAVMTALPIILLGPL